MSEESPTTTPKTCRECGQDLGLVPVGDLAGAPDAASDPDMDWAEFCPSPDCPVKQQHDG